MKTRIVSTSADKNFQKAMRELETKKAAMVGWFESATYDDKDETPVAFVAAQNEYGNPAKRIPARPFMRPTVIEKRTEWQGVIDRMANRILEGKASSDDALTVIGEKAAADIREKITDIWEPELSPVTIKNRLSRYRNQNKVGNLYKPLVDTGHMLATLTSRVQENDSPGE